jgi:hypothetical protein
MSTASVPTHLRVIFSLEYSRPDSDTFQIRLTGSHWNDWSVPDAPVARFSGGDAGVYEVVTWLPAGEGVSFKWVVRNVETGAVEWEGGANRHVEVIPGLSVECRLN